METTPPAKVVVEIPSVAALTMMLSSFVADCAGLPESTTFSVKLYVPGVVAVPLITPVLAFNDKPGGNEPAETLQVSVPEPPDSVRVEG